MDYTNKPPNLSYSSAVDTFSLPQTNASSLSNEWAVFYPISHFRDTTSPLQFSINTTPTHYLDLSSARLYLKVKIVDSAGKDVGADKSVAPTFNFYAALWDSIECLVNGYPVSRCSQLVGLRQHITNLISTTELEKTNVLEPAQIFIPESLGKQDTFDSTNAGYIERKKIANASKYVFRNLFCTTL